MGVSWDGADRDDGKRQCDEAGGRTCILLKASLKGAKGFSDTLTWSSQLFVLRTFSLEFLE